MARTYTTAQRNAIASRQKRVWVKSEVENAGGVMISFQSLSGRDWFHSARWKKTADAPNWEGTVTFMREHGSLSLAPEVIGSPLNNVGGTYNPAIDGMRRVRLSTAIMAPGAAPVAGDYTEVFDGFIASPEWGGRDEGLIRCQVRDKYALLMKMMTSFGYVYGSPTGMPMEDALQQLLDDHENPKLGPVTLWLPNGPPLPGGFPVMQTERTLDQGPLLLAMRNIADQIGWTVGPLYDSTNTLRLAFYRADRTKTVPDYTLSLDEIFEIDSYEVPTDDIRNQVEVGFVDRATGVSMSYRTDDTDPANAASILRYGPNYMRIQEEWTNNIDSLSEATLMGDAAVSDLRAPYAVQRTRLGYTWIAEIGDLVGMPANAILFDTPRDQAIVEVEHGLENGIAETIIASRDQVIGAYKNWLEKEGNDAEQDQAPEVSLVSATQVSATTADVVIEVATFIGETASVVISDSPGGGTAWNLVTANGDPTPRYVTDGTQLGPADWFYDGTTYAQVLGAIALDPVLPTVLYAQATGRSSELPSAWLPITIPGYETTGDQGGGVTATGVSVDVIIPALLKAPSEGAEALTASTTVPVGVFSYNPAPFTQVRLDAHVDAGAAGALARLKMWDGSAWVALPDDCTVDLATSGGALRRGTAVPQTITAETWFGVFVEGGDPSAWSLWVTFIPRALSLPPQPWVPPILPGVCNTSLSGLEDFGEDWCGYTTNAELMTAYNWAEYPATPSGTFWSDWNEPTEDVEGRDIGSYDNIAVPLALDYQHGRLIVGQTFNGGSNAVEFDSDDAGDTTPDLAIYNYRGQRNNVPVATYPNGSMGSAAKATLVTRMWISGDSDLDTLGNFVEPCYVGWASSGAFGECFCAIGRYRPGDNFDYGSPHLYLTVYSYNTANMVTLDCGPAGDLIGDPIGHEFKLEASISEPTSTAFDKMRANLIVNPLPGSPSTFSGQWQIANQNLMNGSGTWDQRESWGRARRNAGGRVWVKNYSIERWMGDKVWLGGTPAMITDSDVTPLPNDTTVDTASAQDEFTPATRRTGVVVPLDTAYSRYNDGGLIISANKDGNGNALIALDDDGSNTPRGVELVLPDVDGAWDLDVSSCIASEANSGAHIWLRESSTGKWCAFGLHNNGTNRRWSLWDGSGELYRSTTDLAYTAFRIAVERFSGRWYFYRYTPGFNTETDLAATTLFTTKANRIGFGGWAGASGMVVGLNYLRKTS